jgi:hypothetical protein
MVISVANMGPFCWRVNTQAISGPADLESPGGVRERPIASQPKLAHISRIASNESIGALATERRDRAPAHSCEGAVLWL